MRVTVAAVAALVVFAPALPAMAQSCSSEIEAAQRFVDKLRPGPNTRQAERHIAAARRARSERQCMAELRRANTFAERSAAADRRLASRRRS
jgi:hypothetical protein